MDANIQYSPGETQTIPYIDFAVCICIIYLYNFIFVSLFITSIASIALNAKRSIILENNGFPPFISLLMKEDFESQREHE